MCHCEAALQASSRVIEINSKSITGLTIQLFSDVATQSPGLHQTVQRIVDWFGHVTCFKGCLATFSKSLKIVTVL